MTRHDRLVAQADEAEALIARLTGGGDGGPTDDDRIERVFDALHRQAADLQIIVLSCRQRAFRDLGGRVLRFEQVREVVA